MAIEDAEDKPLSAIESLQQEFEVLFPHLRGPYDVLSAAATGEKGLAALCLSGGGIRSATFSLGVLQGLAYAGLLEDYDYLSTVSGGGYIGGWLSRWRAGDTYRPAEGREIGKARDALFETPDDTRPPRHPLRRLRSFSNYLSPIWGLSLDTLTVASIFLRNLLLNFLFWIPLLLLVAMLPWLFATAARASIAEKGVALGPWLFGYFDVAAFGVPALMAALWMGGALAMLLVGWSMSEGWRERVSRYSAFPLLFGIVWLLLFAAFAYLPWFVLLQVKAFSAQESAVTVAGGGLFAILAGMAGYWSRYGPDLRRKAYGFANALGARMLDLLALLTLLILAIAATLAMRAWLASGPVSAGSGTRGPAFYWIASSTNAGRFLNTGLALIVTVAAAGFFVGANRFSLHALYGNRLVRAYLGSARRRRHPSPATDFDPHDNVNMTALPGGKDWPERYPPWPFHVVNMTLNLSRRFRDQLDWQERKGASFTATPIHCGSPATGYLASERFGGANRIGEPTGMTLGRAMTISGAAASPNMGYHGSPLMALVMTFFNIRLGWWVPNPKWIANREAPLLRQEPLYGLGYVLREAFLGTSLHSNWLYLSDGGHFDNLGLYEMVRRRCRHIVVVDAGCDGEFKYADLHNAIRKIAVDLAVPIDFPAQLPGQKGPAERERVAIGTIRYDALRHDYKNGKLFLIKPILVGDEPPALREYADVSRHNGKTFPHHSTVDQFFNETQFESYRSLGQWSVRALLAAVEEAENASEPRRGMRPPSPPDSAQPFDRPPDPPPPARLTGLPGIEAGVRALSPVQMIAGAIATAGVVGAAATVGQKAVDRAIVAFSPPPKIGVIKAELDSDTRKLLQDGVTVTADAESLKQIKDVKNALADAFAKWPTPTNGDGANGAAQLAIMSELRGITNTLEDHVRQRIEIGPVKANLNSDSLKPVLDRLDELAKLETANGRTLATTIGELRTIAARLQDSSPRRNVRGS